MARAIVVGAGIGGLAAAAGLVGSGWEVRVLERSERLAEVGAGLSLWPNAFAALRRLGLDELVRSLGRVEAEGALRTDRGEVLMQLGTPELRAWGDTVIVHRGELQAALAAAVGAERIELGREVVGYRHVGSGVAVELRDGGTEPADLVVGADGVRSAIRRRMIDDGPPRYAGYTAWRAIVEPPPSGILPGESWGRGQRFGQVPLADGRVYWFATRNGPPGERSPDGEKRLLGRIFADWHDPIPALVAATSEAAILRNDIVDRPPARRWCDGPVVLLGDAAHPMTPNLGQGACQAIEDAAVLAAVVAASGSVTEALARYEEVRSPRANAIVVRSRRIGEVGQWSHPIAVALRTWAARRLLPRLQPRALGEVLAFPDPG